MRDRDNPPYYIPRRGRAFFQLGRKRAARARWAPSIPLGQAGNKAKAEAWRLYHEWLEICGRKQEEPEPPKYPPGSFGSWFEHYRQSRAWARKAPATRQEWHDSWRYIAPYLASKPLLSIRPNDIEAMHETLEAEHGETIRWRAVKITRALFNAALKHQLITSVPTLTLPNTPPPGRSAVWFASEVVKLIETAEAVNKPAMALAIRIAWETLFQPVDVRTLSLANRYRDGAGAYFQRHRTKTSKQAFGYISDETDALIDAYVAGLPFEVLGEQPFLRTSRDAHEYRKPRFLADFAIVRKAAFGKHEKRRFQDIRRSGNVEADLANASPEDRAEILANTLHKNKFLEATYTPPTVAKARRLAEQRKLGREILEAQNTAQSQNTPREVGPKIGTIGRKNK